MRINDIVRVDFNNAQTTLTFSAKVLCIPNAVGDNWVFEDTRTQTIYWVSEPCTITLLQRGDL